MRPMLVLLAASVLAGCAMGPHHQSPDIQAVAPPAWTTTLPHQATRAGAVDWWAQFGDATLTALVQAALENNPTLEQAAARVMQARAAMGQADSKLLPAIGASASRRDSRVGSVEQTTSARGIDASWEIDLFGGRLRSSQAASARAQASLLTWHHAQVSLAAEVANTYLSLRQCEANVAIAQADVASREKTRELTLLKVEAGATAPAELDRAEAGAADSASTLAAYAGVCERTRHALATLTALAPAELAARVLPTGVLPAPLLDAPPPVPAQVLTQRPDVAAAERQLAAASAEIGVAMADMLPSLTLSGNIGISATQGVSLSTWSFGPSLTLPIFDAGRRASALEAARARHDEARAAWRAVVLVAVQEVEDALTRMATAHARLANAEQAARRYDAYFHAIEARFAAGGSSLLELEDARRLTLSARTARLALQLELSQARVALYKAAGGGHAAQPVDPSESLSNSQ